MTRQELIKRIKETAYLEGDFDREHLLDTDEIRQFREQVLLHIEEVVRGLDRSVRAAARSQLTRLFSPKLLADANWASGRYRPEGGDGNPGRPG